MEATLQALGGLLLKAVPTLLLLVLVHFYLKWMFFRPMGDVLTRRRASTEGLRQASEATLKKASELAASFESKLHEAREQIYQEQDEARRRWISEQTTRVEEARHQARELIHKSKLQLETESSAAKHELAATTDALAEQIAQAVLKKKAVA